MIAYGICVGSDVRLERCARPGLRLVAHPEAPVAESRDNTSIGVAYNEILDAFAPDPDLEALVLLHEDVELRGRGFESRVRHVLGDPTIAVIGAIGGVGVEHPAWWTAPGRCGRVADSYAVRDFGPEGGGAGTGEVDAVDGLLLVLSPWAVRHLRFDQVTFPGFHGYDVDFCFQARAAGQRVVVDRIELFHHNSNASVVWHDIGQAAVAFHDKWVAPPAPAPMARPGRSALAR